jgi:hypothetical protein
VQRAFGRFDLSDVRVATGAPAREASQAIGAAAYTTGDRIAFAETPTLHLVAHEAAHVVQQRAGVDLTGGVGASGDVYERHADQVADAVVRGESAEPLLAATPGGGGGAGVQRFDSPHHVAIGDSVAGEPVVINDVKFSPGELAALADYVGDLSTLETYKKEDLEQMKELLRTGNEECEAWDLVTDGRYSEEALLNEKHFAPGGRGDNFESMFVELFTMALCGAANANGNADEIANARLDLYEAEHYLGDAFSAGHQLAASDVADAVDATLSDDSFHLLIPAIAAGVWDRASETIEHYGLPSKTVPFRYDPLTKGQFMSLATLGGLVTGIEGFHDGLRRYVHEQLDKIGVLVSSPAQPTPWELRGDHTAEPTTVKAMQLAFYEVRRAFEENLTERVADPSALAQQLFDRHRPVPVGDGPAAIAGAIADATRSEGAILDAMISTTVGTIEEVLDYLVVNKPYLLLRELSEVENPVHERPVIAPFQPPQEGVDPDQDVDIDEPEERYGVDRPGEGDFSSDV